MLLVYCCAYDFQQIQAAHDTRVNKTSITVSWYNFCREECEVHLKQQNIQNRDFDEIGQPTEVKIDGSKYFNHKHHRGEWMEGH